MPRYPLVRSNLALENNSAGRSPRMVTLVASGISDIADPVAFDELLRSTTYPAATATEATHSAANMIRADMFRNTPILVSSEGLRPSDSPTRSLPRLFAGPLRSRGSLAVACPAPPYLVHR